jgi:hypothetical protein
VRIVSTSMIMSTIVFVIAVVSVIWSISQVAEKTFDVVKVVDKLVSAVARIFSRLGPLVSK